MSIIFTMYGFVFFRPENLVHFNFYMLLFPCGLYDRSVHHQLRAVRLRVAKLRVLMDLLVGNLPVSDYIRGKFLLFNVSSTLSFHHHIPLRLHRLATPAYSDGRMAL